MPNAALGAPYRQGDKPLLELDHALSPLTQEYPHACHHSGPCGLTNSDANCACAVNRTWCFADCTCDASACQRMYQGCQCLKSCGSSCPCRQIAFDCILERCGCSGCGNTAATRLAPRLSVQTSKIKNAGRGLFADQHIPANAFVGEYRGGVVVDVEYESRVVHDDRMTRMALSKCTMTAKRGYHKNDIGTDHSIDGDHPGNLLVFMNHMPKSKSNARFSYERGAEGKKVRVYSTKKVEPGEEIYIFYG